MSKERDLLNRAAVTLKVRGICPLLMAEIQELLVQPEYIKTKKEQEIYFVKDEFGTLKPTFKNPKKTPIWVDVLHGGGE